MKVLLVSNTYIELTLLNMLDDLLPYKITQVILLEENHIANDSIKCIHDILICSNLEEGIKQCDIVLLIKYPEMNSLLEDRIIYDCNNYKRKFIIIGDLANTSIADKTTVDPIKYNNIPVVLLFGIGTFNQHLYVEFILNRIFKKIGVNVRQFYSIEAQNLLRQVTLKNGEKYCDNYEIIIQFISHNNINDILQNDELLKILKTIKPDFTIVNIEAGLNEKSDVETIIKNIQIRYNIKIDMIISSSFCSIKDNKSSYMPIYYNKKQPDAFYSTEDISLEAVLKQKIITKITLPTDVYLL